MSTAPRPRTKVLIVINDFLIGGAQKLIVDLLERIDQSRFEVALMTLFQFEEDDRAYLYDTLPANVSVYRLRFRGVRDLASWWELYRTLRTIDPDVVLSNLFFSNTAVRVLSPLFRYHVLAVEHNTYIGKTRLHRFLDRLLAHFTYRIVAVSETVARFTARQEGIPLRKFLVIRNGISLAEVRHAYESFDEEETRTLTGFNPTDRIILNVSRVVPQKNHRLLLEGFARFAATHTTYRLLVVGGGSDYEKMQAYAKELGLAETVRFLGYRKDVPRFFKVADFFVSTSLIEGFGIAHLEALASGLPVLTTKTAGPDEMVLEGENGSFILDETPEGVAAGMARMAESDLKAMRIAALATAERYDIEQTVRAYEELFDVAVQKQRP